MRRYLLASVISFGLAVQVSPAVAAPPAKAVPTPAEKPLLEVKFDAKTGKLFATLPKPGPDGVSGRYIYITQLETGLGSAPTQLDFGAASNSRILVFRRVGKKVVADVENSRFVSSNPAEQLTTEHSFPTSRLWMGDVTRDLPDGSYQADISGFLARDDINIPRVIKKIGGGEFKFVPELSAADPAFVKLFPKNVELAARITFRSDDPKDGDDQHPSGRHDLDRHRAALVDRASGARLCAANRPVRLHDRSAAGRFLKAARGADRHRSRAAVPAGEGRSDRGSLAGEEADYLLYRPRHAARRSAMR